nr:hypothetical protein [Tanacetum cinerariifolium]
MNDTSSTVNHNAYMASAPQIDCASIAHYPSEFSSPKIRLVVSVFQKGYDPIDAINHMISFLTSVVTSSVVTTNAAYQADDLDAYDLDCDELNSAKALGFQNPCYLKKAQQLKPKLYDGCIIEKSEAIVVPDTEETLMLAEESRSKMIEKQNDPQMIEKKVIMKPINYAILNQLSTYFKTRFVPQTESSAEQAFWSQYSV